MSAVGAAQFLCVAPTGLDFILQIPTLHGFAFARLQGGLTSRRASGTVPRSFRRVDRARHGSLFYIYCRFAFCIAGRYGVSR
jgi:hypothetical protein